MELDKVDRLIADLGEEALAGQSDEYARNLMADAHDILAGYRLQVRTAGAIALVLAQAQAICDAAVPTPGGMIIVLQEKVQRMQKAARRYMDAVRESKLLEPRESPEDMASRVIAECIQKGQGTNISYYLAQAIRKDRLSETRN